MSFIAQNFDQLVIEKALKDDEFYQGLVDECKKFIDEKKFSEAFITLHQLNSVEMNRELFKAFGKNMGA